MERAELAERTIAGSEQIAHQVLDAAGEQHADVRRALENRAQQSRDLFTGPEGPGGRLDHHTRDTTEDVREDARLHLRDLPAIEEMTVALRPPLFEPFHGRQER